MCTQGDDLAHVSRVNELVQRIIGYYIGLEDFYMTTNIRKAIAINEHLESGVFQSSLSSDDTGNPTSRRKGSSGTILRNTHARITLLYILYGNTYTLHNTF